MKSRIILLLITLLGFGLRLYELDAQSFWYDEGVTAQVAQLGIGELARWTANDIQPPLYYLLVGGWLRITPFGELVLRFPSVLWGTSLIPLIWALGRRLWRQEAGLLAALITALSPLLIYYSQEARMYALLVLFVTAFALLVVRYASLEQGALRWRNWLLYIAVGLAALYTHYFAGIALLALILYWVWIWIRAGWSGDSWQRFLVAHFLIIIGYLPWLPAMINRFRMDSSYWMGTLKLDEAFLDVMINFTVGATEVMREGDAIAWLPGFVVIALIALITLATTRGRHPHRPLALILLWLVVPVSLILLLAYRSPKFNARYLMISWPAWALLMGGGISQLWLGASAWKRLPGVVTRSLALVALAFLVLASGIGLRNWYLDDNFAKSAWREAISYMYHNRTGDDIVLLVSGHSYPVFDTYIPARFGVRRERLPEMDILDVNQVLDWQQVSLSLNALQEQAGGVWLFRWQDEVIDPAGITASLLERYAQVQEVPEFAYLGLDHYLFDSANQIPPTPPALPEALDFGDELRLYGAEGEEGGLWLYWQALRPIPADLQMALTVTRANGDILAMLDQRPVGYLFPTTRWGVGAIYPWRLAIPELRSEPITLELTIYDAGTGKVIGVQRLDLDAAPPLVAP